MLRGHQERLPVMVAELFRDADLTPRDLTHVGVTLGPGSFSGLRVGLSFAKGLALGLGLALKGVGTLEALTAHPALEGREAVAVISGGRGSFYIRRGLHAPQAIGFADLQNLCDIRVLTGPAMNEVRPHFPEAEAFPQDWPALEALAALTMLPGHDDLTPQYMRGADAVASMRGIIVLAPQVTA
ncbi:hypothetical protein ABAC402_07975 [Asticcacaulis sp. AC402]|nr:hypothetical protein ABAC402_07975 [Asticcacaulis sp. AC402]